MFNKNRSFDNNRISKLPDGFFDLDNLRRLWVYLIIKIEVIIINIYLLFLILISIIKL